MAEARRRGGSYRDMLLTLAIFVAVIVTVVSFLPKNHTEAPATTPVGYAVPLASLRSAAPFPVYAPARAPTGWTPNHVITHVPSGSDPSYSLDLGFYITAADQYAQVEQSDAAGFLAAQLGRSPRQTRTETVAGTVWQTWLDSGGHPALVRAVATSTLVLDGGADAAHLRTLAASLSLQRAQDLSGAVH